MKPSIAQIPAQYIVNKTGKKTGIIVDIETFEKLLEEIEDVYLGALATAALKQEQEYIPHEEVKRRQQKRK